MLGKCLKFGWRVAKFVVDATSKRYLLPLYERSDRLYRQSNSLGARWNPLTEYLEYSIETTNIFDHKNGRKQRIALRKRPDVLPTIDLVTLIIKAHSQGYSEPERIVTEDVEETPQSFILRNIPIEMIYVGKKGGIFTSYEMISITVKEIISRGKPLPFSSSVKYFTPTHYDCFNDNFREKWGRFWNFGLYKLAKDQLQIAMSVALGFEVGLPRPWMHKSLWDKIRIAAFLILTRPFILNTIFWTAVISRAMDIDDNGEITSNLRWLNISKMRKGCIGKKGAPYAAFFRGVTNVWGVSRSWIAADG